MLRDPSYMEEKDAADGLIPEDDSCRKGIRRLPQELNAHVVVTLDDGVCLEAALPVAARGLSSTAG